MSRLHPSPAERRQQVLTNIDQSGYTSPEARRRGKFLVLAATTVMTVGIAASEPISNGATIIGNRIDNYLDNHNNPPDGVIIVNGNLPAGVPTRNNDISQQSGELLQNQELQP